jgi:hypothetical protein
MPRSSRQELEAENLVLVGKLAALRDEIDDFLDDADSDSEDNSLETNNQEVDDDDSDEP